MEWEKSPQPKWIETSHLPEVEIKSFSNNPRKDDPNTDVLRLQNLSIWSTWDDDEYLKNLRTFAQSYKKWIVETQSPVISNEPDDQKRIGQYLKKNRKRPTKVDKNINFLNKERNRGVSKNALHVLS